MTPGTKTTRRGKPRGRPARYMNADERRAVKLATNRLTRQMERVEQAERDAREAARALGELVRSR